MKRNGSGLDNFDHRNSKTVQNKDSGQTSARVRECRLVRVLQWSVLGVKRTKKYNVC